MELDLVTGPTLWPVTVAEAKKNSNITHNDDDGLFEELIRSATEQVQEDIPGKRQLLTATYDLVLECFPSDDGPIRFPRPPLQSITSVSYYDTTNSQQTLAASKYLTRKPTNLPGYIYPAVDEIWPDTEARADAVIVRFIAGWSTTASVPRRARQAVKMLVSHWYENREVSAERSIREVEMAYTRLINGLGWGFI